MQAIAFAVEKQRQGSPFCHVGSLLMGGLGREGGVKVEVVLWGQAGRRSHNWAVVLVVLQAQVHISHLSCCWRLR